MGGYDLKPAEKVVYDVCEILIAYVSVGSYLVVTLAVERKAFIQC